MVERERLKEKKIKKGEKKVKLRKDSNKDWTITPFCHLVIGAQLDNKPVFATVACPANCYRLPHSSRPWKPVDPQPLDTTPVDPHILRLQAEEEHFKDFIYFQLLLSPDIHV